MKAAHKACSLTDLPFSRQVSGSRAWMHTTFRRHAELGKTTKALLKTCVFISPRLDKLHTHGGHSGLLQLSPGVDILLRSLQEANRGEKDPEVASKVPTEDSTNSRKTRSKDGLHGWTAGRKPPLLPRPFKK